MSRFHLVCASLVLTREHDSGEMPLLSIADCEVLEDLFVSVLRATTPSHCIAPLLASITSPHFQRLILKLRTTAQRESDAVQTSLVDGISQLDRPLYRLAQGATGTNHRVSLMLLGQEPEFLSPGALRFSGNWLHMGQRRSGWG